MSPRAQLVYYAPGPVEWRHNPSTAVVCLSVCHVPDLKSRMEGHRKLKIGRKEAHVTGDP